MWNLSLRCLITISFYMHTYMWSHWLGVYVYLWELILRCTYCVLFMRATVLNLEPDIVITQLLIAEVFFKFWFRLLFPLEPAKVVVKTMWYNLWQLVRCNLFIFLPLDEMQWMSLWMRNWIKTGFWGRVSCPQGWASPGGYRRCQWGGLIQQLHVKY